DAGEELRAAVRVVPGEDDAVGPAARGRDAELEVAGVGAEAAVRAGYEGGTGPARVGRERRGGGAVGGGAGGPRAGLAWAGMTGRVAHERGVGGRGRRGWGRVRTGRGAGEGEGRRAEKAKPLHGADCRGKGDPHNSSSVSSALLCVLGVLCGS